jgi:hypothetical protein
MLVALAIFSMLGTVLVGLLWLAADAWRSGERVRATYERAQAVLSQLSVDLEAVYSREPESGAASGKAAVPTARMFCFRRPDTGTQQLSFVRTFESGPERSLTFRAGRGRVPYTDGFTGDPAELMAPGGLIGVTYSVKGRDLRRVTLGPPRPPGKKLESVVETTSGEGEVLAGNVLHLGFRFWTQYTRNWREPPPLEGGRGPFGPETVWDSTRGIPEIRARDPRTGRERPFFMARGPESLGWSADDVFPEIVEVTLVVEPDDRRAVRTELIRPLSASGLTASVATTAGFEHPETGTPFVLIGGEWVRLKDMGRGEFVIAERGARGTGRASHARGTEVRQGTAFVQQIRLPGFREDWSRDADFRRMFGVN